MCWSQGGGGEGWFLGAWKARVEKREGPREQVNDLRAWLAPGLSNQMEEQNQTKNGRR